MWIALFSVADIRLKKNILKFCSYLLPLLGGGDGDLDMDLESDLDLDLDLDRDFFLSFTIFFAFCLALKNSNSPSFSHPSLHNINIGTILKEI